MNGEVSHRCHSMARWACCPGRHVAWWGTSEPKQGEQRMHTGEGSAQSIRTQSYMGWKDSIKREETVTMVTSDWLHTGRLIKCVTPHTGLSPMWTHSSSCLGSSVPHKPAVCVHSSLALPHLLVLGLNYSRSIYSRRRQMKRKRGIVFFLVAFFCLFVICSSSTANILWQVVCICCPHFLLFSHFSTHSHLASAFSTFWYH